MEPVLVQAQNAGVDVTTVPQPPTQVSNHLAEAMMRRLQIAEALDLANKLYDRMSVKRERMTKFECDLDVVHYLCFRKVVVESLFHELTVRKLLPVTLGTLSNLFAQSYASIVLQ